MTDATHEPSEQGQPAGLGCNEGLGPLVECPLCGADKGYRLSDGDTYRWWDVYCASCGGTVAECSSDRRTHLGTELPARWPAADEAWNSVGAYAHKLRTLLARYRDETPLGHQPHMIAHQADEALGRA
jgi:hypothetical protein